MIYDLDTLKRGLQGIEKNILALEEALVNERQKKSEYERHIAAAEVILAQHGVDHDGRPH